jgi:Zn-dependent protease
MNMNKQRSGNSTLRDKKDSGHSLSLFTLFGIEIRLDISVIIIFSLIVYSLGNGVYASWHPDWTPAVAWGTALFSGLAFFASLLAHELSHSVVSQHFGIPVPRITLFLFGGVAEISREPDRPKHEFLIAIAGPMMSLVIALVCSNLAFYIAGDMDLAATINSGDLSVIASLGPLATALFWLGSINMLLAIFNMIPGFPMDGGRVFRATIWAVTGDQLKATLWASNVGRYFGWFLMAMGVMGLLQGRGIGSLWSILIGWFLSNLATMSYRQLVTDRALGGFRIADLMRTHFETVDANMPLAEFVDNYLLRSSQRLWPVTRGGKLAGSISLARINHLPAENRAHLTLAEAMSAVEDIDWLEPQTQAKDAINILVKAGDEPILVVENEKVLGLVQHSDIVKWLSLHQMTA